MCVRVTEVHTKTTFFNLTDILDCFSKDILRGVAQVTCVLQKALASTSKITQVKHWKNKHNFDTQ